MKQFIYKYKSYFIGSTIALGVILLDQLTKWLTRLYIPNQYGSFNEPALKIIPNFFHLVEHHNFGVSWSSFENNVFVLYVVPIIALTAFGYLFTKADFKSKKFYSIGLALMIAGTIGNFIDRLSFGYVIDFLQFIFGSYVYPTFNVADMSLVTGVIMFAIDILFFEDIRNKKAQTESDPTEEHENNNNN